MIPATCHQCGRDFQTWPYRIREGRGRYCSRHCFNISQLGQTRPKPRSLEERFWEKVERRGRDDCWTWLGSKTVDGYGRIGHNGKVRAATHISWEMHHGADFPPGMLACHSCDNPECVNPAHLFVGSKQDNADDMVRKGRSTKDRRRSHCVHGHALTPDNVYVYAVNGARQCATCRAIRSAQFYREHRPTPPITHPRQPHDTHN